MPERILIVDDDQLILMGILQVRKRLGYQFEAALSSRQALEKIRSDGPYDAVLTDWDMPGMNGLTFLERCRETAPEMVRLMLSGSDFDDTIQQAIHDRLLFRFIAKPCTPHQLGQHLGAALASYKQAVVAVS